jgi:Na+-translocating ferredoxin:NAD+ oxidoreductase RnfG subunit
MLDLLAFTFVQMMPAYVARAEVFMSDEGAARLMFPTLVMTPKLITLGEDQIKIIEKASGQDVREKTLKAFVSKSGEIMFVDKVLGKHDFITYALGLGADHKIKQIEILEYKETYGHEIKRVEWRKQFYGKDLKNELKLTKDIQNISGATLSCKHVTDGVRRLLDTYDVIHASI